LSRLIIDASVAVKLLVDEDGAALAAFVYRAFDLLAPALLLAECSNILWKKVRKGELSKAEAMTRSVVLTRTSIVLRPMEPLVEAATRLSIDLDHPAYDCFYLALAVAEACPFVTADERLVRKVEAVRGGPEIRLLSSFTV
jgi:predicted nucleic acid-binding protein